MKVPPPIDRQVVPIVPIGLLIFVGCLIAIPAAGALLVNAAFHGGGWLPALIVTGVAALLACRAADLVSLRVTLTNDGIEYRTIRRTHFIAWPDVLLVHSHAVRSRFQQYTHFRIVAAAGRRLRFFTTDVASRPLRLLYRKCNNAVIIDDVGGTFRAPRKLMSPGRHRELAAAARSARRITAGRAVRSFAVLGLIGLYITAVVSRGVSPLKTALACLPGMVIAWQAVIEIRRLRRTYRAIDGLVASSRVG